MITTEIPLIDPTLLFRFETTLRMRKFTHNPESWVLPADCRLPAFDALAGRPHYAEVRMAWSEDGIVFWMQATNKKQLPICREQRPGDSDGFHLWLDTRNSADIHRASRYCHHFAFCPMGAGTKRDRPFMALVPINRAKENPQPIMPNALQSQVKLAVNGYQISGIIPASAMTGFDPQQFPQLGFWWAVMDDERGWQTMSLSREYPVTENPSLWSTARLAI
jgi:hypothetical protein